jgi:hypothetical protein
MSYPPRHWCLALHVPLAMSPVSDSLPYRDGGGDGGVIFVVEKGAPISLSAGPLREEGTSLPLPG